MRERLSPTVLRVCSLAVILVCGGLVAYGTITDAAIGSREPSVPAPPTENHTVVTQSGRIGNIVAYAPNGSVVYFDEAHSKYYDVDPVDDEAMTVEYVASDTIRTEGPRCRDPPCTRNVIERVNISTGEVTQVYVRYDYRENVGEWHDADRIDERHVVVADIVADQVFVVDTETGLIEWAWDAQSDFPVEGGGPYPGNWVHLNDVEVLEDGRVMVSLRNQDQVVFLDPETGLVDEWTLGAEDDHATLYEQHNPDYIPPARGGPAVLVSDSQNGRIVEYQREDGEWVRSWEWADERMEWPRDADRLSNGNTLITDTGGGRVIEVNATGEIVWQVDLPHPYDAERLETGDESSDGRSARELDLEPRTNDDGDGGRGFGLGWFRTIVDGIRDLLPSRLTNAIIDLSPTWLDPRDLVPLTIGFLAGLIWVVLELGWYLRSRGVRVRWPVYREED